MNTAQQKIGFRVALATLACVLVLVVLGPMFLPWEYQEIDWDNINQAPSIDHWFGTDASGRDVLTRTLVGGRISLIVALLATCVSFLIGVPWGAIAGLAGGRADQVMMRIVDGMYALPFVLIVILLVVLFGRNVYLLFVGLGAVSWLDISRIVRGQTLVVRNEQYILAANALGASQVWIVWKHVLPNIIGTAFVYATLTIPGVIIAESFISFLGLGIQEPQTSLGVLIADGTKEMHSSPWQLAFPAGFLVFTLLALNKVGDVLRDSITGNVEH
ncbi:MAG: ABC transporter permease [Gammaproteobacteria bacterium]|nr:ABC transporter permease [Gammaproteobacteria bacterium]MYD79137.1 ABC transporter permease [Gammaproteobacteria bacterium]